MLLLLSAVLAVVFCLLAIWEIRRHLPRDPDDHLRKSLGASERHREARWRDDDKGT